TQQFPVVVEPIAKLFRPLIYLFSPNIGFWNGLYFVLVLVATMAVWALFGGAITRIAALQIAREERVDFMSALRFTWRRIVSFVVSPVATLIAIAVVLIGMIFFGLLFALPVFGDIVMAGVLWWLMLL